MRTVVLEGSVRETGSGICSVISDSERWIELIRKLRAQLRDGCSVPDAKFSLDLRGGNQLEDTEIHHGVREIILHLERAAAVHRALQDLEAAYEASVAALNMFPIGVALLASDKRALFSNRAARHITDQADGISIDRYGRYFATTHREDVFLQAYIEAAYTRSKADTSTLQTAIKLSRKGPRKPLSVMVSYSPSASCEPSGHASVVLIVSDPESAPGAVVDLLSTLHGLTRAEARMAGALIRGQSLAEYASQRGISRNTAKSQLRQILAKTGAQRQADLVRIILTSPVMLATQSTAPI